MGDRPGRDERQESEEERRIEARERTELLRALESWGGVAVQSVEPLPGGLINRSWAVRALAGEYVAQRLNPIFSEGVNRNLQRVSDHLEGRGPRVPRLLENDSGGLFVDLPGAGRWRLMERLPGVSFERCQKVGQARSAAALVARFHSELGDWRGGLEEIGFPYHDLGLHLLELRRTLEERSDHRLHGEVSALASRIFEVAGEWRDLSALPRRVVHGDLKFSNLLFEGREGPPSEVASALIDLDTVCYLPLYYDLGDAWRSWCNTGGEDLADPTLDLEIFYASAEAYLSGLRLEVSAAELDSLVDALERVSLELCSRYAKDALEETYFAWDSEHYASAAEHNWLRARGQWRLHLQARETRGERARFLLS
jgi:Ser/Thr protein kinase RdoA (MazF antagonist)